MPIVIWSHGGAGGKTDATTALEGWATEAAEAGYFSIAIAHAPRDTAEREALCTNLGFDAAGCATFKFLDFDRPLDISRTIDATVLLSETPAFANRIDVSRIVVAGHSAGAGGTLMVAGAARDMNGTKLMADERPLAFVALSPQAPGSDGFDEAGYALVTRPTLIATGRGDENPPDTADGRASVFDLVQPGDKARLFIEDAAANHGLFALELEGCVESSTSARCTEMASWLRSAVLAFLDAHLRDAPAAREVLASSNFAVASDGVAVWSTR
jgi:hypothetical protein